MESQQTCPERPPKRADAGTTIDDGGCPSFVLDTGDTVILKPLDGRTLGERLRPVFSATE
jgi:hypothetical protein